MYFSKMKCAAVERASDTRPEWPAELANTLIKALRIVSIRDKGNNKNLISNIPKGQRWDGSQTDF